MPSTIVVVEPGFYILASLLGLAIAAWAALMVIQFNAVKGNLMGINEDLAQIKANLAEASGELVSKIEGLEKKAAAGETVDPQLLSDVKDMAQSLSDIVPDAAVPVPVPQAVPGAVPSPVPPVVEQAVPEKLGDGKVSKDVLGEGKVSKKEEDTADTKEEHKGEHIFKQSKPFGTGDEPDEDKGDKPYKREGDQSK